MLSKNPHVSIANLFRFVYSSDTANISPSKLLTEDTLIGLSLSAV